MDCPVCKKHLSVSKKRIELNSEKTFECTNKRCPMCLYNFTWYTSGKIIPNYLPFNIEFVNFDEDNSDAIGSFHRPYYKEKENIKETKVEKANLLLRLKTFLRKKF
jgi:hypothetical protein